MDTSDSEEYENEQPFRQGFNINYHRSRSKTKKMLSKKKNDQNQMNPILYKMSIYYIFLILI